MKFQSDNLDEILPAFLSMQQSLNGITKNKANTYYNSQYADLHHVLMTIKDPLKKNGLCILQTYETYDNIFYVVSTLYHSSGQFFRSYAPIIGVKDPQKLGSATTYLRRYAIAAMCGLAQKDDDANSATYVSNKEVKDILKLLEGHKGLYDHIIDVLAKKDIKSFSHIPDSLYPELITYINKCLSQIKEAEEKKDDSSQS